jgi:CHASE2 domain-containing sensor protein
MINVITGLIGIFGICAYLGFLLVWVKAIPLIVICTVVVALLVYDFVKSLSADKNGAKG